MEISGLTQMAKKEIKKVLFVEDRTAAISDYIEYLQEDKRIDVEVCYSIEQAFDSIQDGEIFDFIIIDLNNPPIPEALKKYKKRLNQMDLNEGQALGLWLDDEYSKIPYVYLSVMPIVMDDELQEQIEVLDKNSLKPKEFHEKINNIYMTWHS